VFFCGKKRSVDGRGRAIFAIIVGQIFSAILFLFLAVLFLAFCLG
jgi:hypothetical protein